MTSDSSFGELAGIRPAREILVHTASKLDQLVSIGNDIIEKYHSATKGRGVFGAHHETYTAIEAELAGSELEYGVSDFQELVRAYCNQDDSEQEAIARGLYTGALASVLTKRNREKGERTHIYLNGDGNTFPYLLYFARTLDEVTIENFNGDYIARDAAGHGGTAKSITLANITGYGAGLYIAWNKGRVETVTLVNITGDRAGVNIAWNKGRVEIVTLANITGNDVGEYIAGGNGRVGIVTLANITGDDAGVDITGYNGHVGIVSLVNITGNRTGACTANDGRVDVLLTVNNKGERHLYGNGAYRKITSLAGLRKADEIQALIEQLSQPDRAPKHYANASKQLGELLRAEP